MNKKNMVKKDCSATTTVSLSIYDIIKLHPGLRKVAGVADRQTDLKTFKIISMVELKGVFWAKFTIVTAFQSLWVRMNLTCGGVVMKVGQYCVLDNIC